jgi:hypothetical protein
MHTRVVRFTDVTPERIEEVRTRIEEAGGPPPGVRSTGMTVLHDEEQGTAIVIQEYASAEDLRAAEEVFSAMPTGETPGTRASVDRCTQVVDKRL